jgi:hypothetical protein
MQHHTAAAAAAAGDCKFKTKCIYHHPDNVALPERFVLTGKPCKVSYSYHYHPRSLHMLLDINWHVQISTFVAIPQRSSLTGELNKHI